MYALTPLDDSLTTTEDCEQSLAVVKRAIATFGESHPYFYAVLAKQKLVPDPEREWAQIGSICTDGKGKIWFYPPFILEMDEEELTFLLGFTALMIVFDCTARAKGKHHHTWNFACHITIMAILSDAKLVKAPRRSFRNSEYEKLGLTISELYEKLVAKGSIACDGYEDEPFVFAEMPNQEDDDEDEVPASDIADDETSGC